MERVFRISAGAIIIRDNAILLVRYPRAGGTSYLVGPGGGAFATEGIYQTAIREVREETGLEVSPSRILFVEDLLAQRHRIIKIWLLCNLIGGSLAKTKGADEEGITEVRWYRQDQLANETVYPTILSSLKWNSFFMENWETRYLGIQTMDWQPPPDKEV